MVIEATAHDASEQTPIDKDFWILSLSGGGFRGLFTAKILEQLENIAGCPLARKFDLIAGTSIGSILAAAIAKEIPAKDLPGLFINHGNDIFKKNPFSCRGWYKAQYSSDALKKLLLEDDKLGETRFCDLRHRIIIPAVNLTKGAAQYFKTQHAPKFNQDGMRKIVDAVMASAAAPSYFPIYTFESQRYADGGLVANSPALQAIHESVYILNKNVKNVYVISIGTMSEKISQNPDVPLDAGIFNWGRSLVTMPMSAQETMSDDMAQHIVGKRWIKIDSDINKDISNSVGLDQIDTNAQDILIGRAKIAAQENFNNNIIRRWLDHTASKPIFYNQD